jgi:RNA polymerase sigma factor (sigma-70 family)
MPTPINEVVQHLRRAVLRHEEAGLTDGQLLRSFLEHRDASAAAALVRRHAPMVWGVCRRVLQNHHDAEDAFQATFVVFSRKAGSVRPREMVGNWLYGVAHQTALKARALRAKRRARERQVADMPDTTALPQEARNDLQLLLDQELSRLPDKYRVAIVLCDLQGKTRREAARQLGLPEGTLAGRLTRGRALLARRLSSRGVAVSGATLPALLAPQAATAGVPAAVLSSTIEAVTLMAAGQAAAGLVSAKVAVLSEGVVKAMLLSKLKVATTVVLVMAVLGAGVATRARDGQSRAGEAATAQHKPSPKGKHVPESPKNQSDQEAIQGVWKIVAWEVNGWREPVADYAGVRITADTVFIKEKGIDKLTEYTYTLDPTHKPKRIDWVGTEEFLKSEGGLPREIETRRFTLQGIYHLDGDNLTLCFHRADEKRNRPTKFETQPGNGGWLLVLQREQPLVTPEGGKRVAPKVPPQHEGPATKGEPGKNAYLDLQGKVVKNQSTDGWEVELKIPKEHLGKVLSAFDPARPRPGIYVLVLLPSSPTRTYNGTLWQDQIQPEADRRGTEVLAWVRVPDPRNPRRSLFNAEDQQSVVHVRIVLGKHAEREHPIRETTIRDVPGTGAAPASGKPDIVFRTELRKVRLPVDILAEQRDTIKEVQLYASADEGKTWWEAGRIGPDGDSFDFEAPRDGVYWFSLRTIHRDGTAEPRDLSSLSATLKFQMGAAKQRPGSPQQSIEELNAEVKVLRQQLRQLEQRLAEMEKAKQR